MKTENFFVGQVKFNVGRFSERVNKNDPSDVVDAKNLNFKAYQKRVGNLILELIYEKMNKRISLTEFLLESWAKNEYKIVVKPDVLFETENNLIGLKGDTSPPFLLSNSSFNDDHFQFNNFPDDDLEISEIQDNLIQPSLIGKSELKLVLDDSSKSSLNLESIPKIHINSPKIEVTEEDERQKLDLAIKNRKSTQKLNWLNENVIKEASNSERSESNAPVDSEMSFTGLDSAFRQPNDIPSIVGMGSHIKKVSESESSDQDGNFLIFNQLVQKSLEITKVHEEPLIVNHEETTDQAIKVQEEYFTPSQIQNKNPWFSVSIIGQETHFKNIFKSFCPSGELINLTNLPALFTEALKSLKIFPYEHLQESFKAIYEDIYSGKFMKNTNFKQRILNIKVNFNEFIEMMNLWGEKYQQEQKTLLGSIIRTTDTFISLQNNFSHVELVSILENTVGRLKEVVNDFVHNKKCEKIVEEAQKKNLENIFLFYGKIQKIQGSEPTFEALEVSNTAWNLGKFLKFCSDFKVIGTKSLTKRETSKEKMISIFKKTASFTRIMFFPQFIEALDRLAEVLYSIEFDKLLDSNFAYRPLDEKRGFLYNLLEISNFAKIQEKKKPFGSGFSPEKYSRIPNRDPSHKYKFNLNSKISKNLENWKKVKKEFQVPVRVVEKKSKILSPQPIMNKNYKLLLDGGYSDRARAGNFKGMKSNSEVKFNEVPQVVLKSVSPGVLTEKMTIRSLYSLNYKDIDDEYSLKDLISDEDNEFIDRLYNIDPKLEGILKMQNNRLARSQKVLEKNKYR